METAAQLRTRADDLEKQAATLREAASGARQQELEATPLMDRLVYASTARCNCGAGMAYDPASKGKADSPFKGPSEWECGDILRFDLLPADKQAEVKAATHSAPLPFAFYEVKSEKQPSANGATTRPQESQP